MTGKPNENSSLRSRTAQAAGNIANAPAANENKAVVPTGNKALGTYNSVHALLASMGAEIGRAVPKHMNPERMARIALTVVRTNPKLLECSSASFAGAVMTAAQLGLEPGPLGQSYLVPYRNNKTNTTEVQFITGYKGLIDLFWRSGKLASFMVNEVCERDEFEYEYGSNEHLRHVPAKGARGQVVCYYGFAKFKDGGTYFRVVGFDEIEAHRKKSKAKDSGPWVDFYDQMCRKTVVKIMAPFMPLSVEVAQAIAQDESVRTDANPDSDSIDIEYGVREDEDPPTTEVNGQTVNTDTGEVVGQAPADGQPQEGLFPQEGAKR
jgi:recombination protein RecT